MQEVAVLGAGDTDEDLDVAALGEDGEFVLGCVGGASNVGPVVPLRSGEGRAGDDGGGAAEGGSGRSFELGDHLASGQGMGDLNGSRFV